MKKWGVVQRSRPDGPLPVSTPPPPVWSDGDSETRLLRLGWPWWPRAQTVRFPRLGPAGVSPGSDPSLHPLSWSLQNKTLRCFPQAHRPQAPPLPPEVPPALGLQGSPGEPRSQPPRGGRAERP